MTTVSSATDEIYHNRHLLFHLSDGKVVSSADANWHMIELGKVDMIELSIRGKVYRMKKQDLPSSFVEFIHFRSAGSDMVINEDGIVVPEERHFWTVGWTDGRDEHLCEVNFLTGNIERVYDQPLTKAQKSHFHPQSKVWARGSLQ